MCWEGGFMCHNHETKVSRLQLRNNKPRTVQQHTEPTVCWEDQRKKHPGEDFTRNLLVASALVLCVITLRTGAVPSITAATDAILTAATDSTLLDEQLGKISFVSTLFPEAVLVFGEQPNIDLALPSDATVCHVWSEAEPYVSYALGERTVAATMQGEVTGVYHGIGEERIVQITTPQGITCLLGNLNSVEVHTGDKVNVGDIVGSLATGSELILELRRNGISIDPEMHISK